MNTAFPLPQPVELMQWLTFIHVFFSAGSYLLCVFIPHMVFQQRHLARRIQMSALGIVALIGVGVCGVGLWAGVAQLHFWVWLNLYSVGVAILFIIGGIAHDSS